MANDSTDTNDTSSSLNLDTTNFKRQVSEAEQLGKGLSRTLTKAFTDVAVSGKSLGDAVSSISQQLSKLAISSALKPLQQGFSDLFKSAGEGIGNLLKLSPSSGGGATADAAGGLGSILPFAQGGVVSAPTFFPLSGGTGLAGEAGAEAILPLGRGPDGRLGVRGLGGSENGANVTINIQTPDVEGFRRSEADVAATFARLVRRGRRSL